MMTNNPRKSQSSDDDVVDLTPYISIMWHYKFIGTALILALFFIGYAISFTRPIYYTAETVVAYAPNRDTDANSSISGKLGTLGLIGSNFGFGGISSRLQEDLATLRSSQFIAQFIENQSLTRHLIADKWDIFSQKMHPDSKIYDTAKSQFTKKGRRLIDQNLHIRKFSKLVEISEDKKSTLVTIQFSWPNKIESQQLLRSYMDSLNNYLREIEINEAQRNIDYLMQQTNATDIVELKKTFFSLIETQQKKIMLASTRPDYVFKIIDPPLKPFRKSRPSRLAFALGGGVLGIVLFLGWVVTIATRKSRGDMDATANIG